VEFPEFSLGVGGDRGLGGQLGKLVTRQREVLEDRSSVFGILFAYLVDDRWDAGAVRALEITEDHDRYRRVGGSLEGRPGDVDLLGECQGHDLDALIFAAAEKQHVIARTDLDLIHMATDRNGFGQAAGHVIHQDIPLIVQHENTLAAQRYLDVHR